MGMLILANFLTGALATLFVIVAVLMILVVLIQKPKGGGLSGAFGAGGGGTDQAMFGAKVGDVLTYITVGFFVAFLVLGISLVYAARAESAAAKLGVDTVQPAETTEDAGAGATDGAADGAATSTEPAPADTPTDQPVNQPTESRE